MPRFWKKWTISALSLFCGAAMLVGCGIQAAHVSVPETDLAAEYKGETKDENGNLLVPFDVAYPEAFESGAYAYDENTLLLKMEAGEGLSRSLKSCGVTSLEKFSSTEAGDWYRAALKAGTNAEKAIKKVRSLDEVLVADFDYIYKTDAELDAGSVTENVTADGTDADGLLDDVLANLEALDQWYLTSSAIQPAWRFLRQNGIEPGGSRSVTVAVIDTGVDYTHPDLMANMWVNNAEIPGNGVDDDNNGYVDDIYGANTIADNGGADGDEGDPMDDHGHGTHVAGVIAGVNNTIGIVGVAYNVKIMAVKAGQSTGVFNQSDIAEAILYAYEMGADVINMSFGGSACSIAVQEALQTAYTRSTLVASAGNNGQPNEATDNYKIYGEYLPSYPAALSYVIGVMSVNNLGMESAFTNWDAGAYNSVEYELYAPGEGILSTLPGGKYGKMSGTSMAAPVVSGAAALLRSYYTDRDMYPSKFISAQLSATSQDTAICRDPEDHAVNGGAHNLPMRLNVYDALTKLPKPDVTLYDYYLFDDESIAEGNNGDGVADAGETIAIGAVLRNRWGMSENTVVTVDAGNNPYVEIVTGSVNFEGVGTYSTKDMLVRDEQGVVTGAESPLVIKIADNCPNDYLIRLNVAVVYENGLDEKDTETYSSQSGIEFWARNGVVLTGQITEDQTWTKDNYYIIPSSLYIAERVTVTVEPGTQIQFWSDDPEDPYADQGIAKLTVAGSFIVNGSEEEPVEIFPSEMMGEYIVEIESDIGGWVELNYANVVNPVLTVEKIDHCYMTQNYTNNLKCRSLSSGSVVNSDKNAAVNYADISNTCFYKLVSIEFRSNLINNSALIESIIVNSSNNYFGDNVFNNCGSYQSENIIKSSKLEFKQNQKIEALEIVTRGDTVYCLVDMKNSGFVGIQEARAFAQYYGGDIICIESEEELAVIKSLSVSAGWIFTIGLKYGDSTWINGQPVEDFFMQSLSDEKTNHKDVWYGFSRNEITANPSLRVGLEFPANSVDFSTSGLQSAINEWYKACENNSFWDNAVLNNFNDSDVNNWLRVQAGSRNQSSDYEQVINLSGNWWGTTDEELIEKQIVDFDDYNTLADIDVGDYLTEAPSDTFPFVVDAYLLNSSGERVRTVGNETVTFVVEFNRDMDTSVPLRVRFGAAEPYAEYEIEGDYINARRWEGTYTLTTVIENGNQVINIENGCAADDGWLILCESAGRFQFEIDTSSAQAMILQANPTETGIALTWQQDDFETLMGYNVYRSQQEDGPYTRLNDHVLPVGEETFFDDTVEPGMEYWYTFTVVQTDMTESTPAGKVIVRAMDTMAPDIYHSPVRTAYTGSNLVVSATITDNLQIMEAKLWYRSAGGEWKWTEMTANNSRYSGIIPASDIALEGLEYYIEASDGISFTYEGSAEKPFAVIVKLAVDKNDIGDVDGDGMITAKDALMILQAANDLILLDEEQFLRADIDGDKQLTAADALRVLQYVSGKVTSLFAAV